MCKEQVPGNSTFFQWNQLEHGRTLFNPELKLETPASVSKMHKSKRNSSTLLNKDILEETA